MANNISFDGNLGADCEIKEFGDAKILSFRVANTVGFGERKLTNWFSVNYTYRDSLEWLKNALVKGAQVTVYGELKAEEKGDKTWLNVRANNVSLHSEKKNSDEFSASSFT